MMNYMNQNSGAILAILGTLALLEAGIGWITNEIYGVRDETTGLQGEVSGLRGEISGLRGEVSGLRGEVSGLRGEVSGLRGEVSGLRGEVSGLRGEVSGLRGEVSGLRGEVSGLRGEVSGLRGEVSGLWQDQVATERRLSEKIQATDARNAAVQQSLAQLETKVDALLEAIANHSHTEDGVSFARPVAEPQTGGN